jgi:hypothetical protein
MLHLIVFREICISSENHCSLFRYLQWSILNIQARKSYHKNHNTQKMYRVQHSYIIFLYEFYDVLDFGICARIYVQDVHRDVLILTLCHFWLILTNAGIFHLTLVQYKIWQKSARSKVLSCAWTNRGFSE